MGMARVEAWNSLSWNESTKVMHEGTVMQQ